MYFGEVLILSRYGCQKGINLLVQHTSSSQGHSSSHTDTQRALTSCLNHIHISEGCQWPPWQMKRGSSAPRQQSNVREVITKEGYGRRICTVYQLMLLQGVFFKRLIPSYCPHAELGQYWSKEESCSYGRWAESWRDREGQIFNERFDSISGQWDHKSASSSGFVIIAITIFIIYLLVHYFFKNLQNSSKIHV